MSSSASVPEILQKVCGGCGVLAEGNSCSACGKARGARVWRRRREAGFQELPGKPWWLGLFALPSLLQPVVELFGGGLLASYGENWYYHELDGSGWGRLQALDGRYLNGLGHCITTPRTVLVRGESIQRGFASSNVAAVLNELTAPRRRAHDDWHVRRDFTDVDVRLLAALARLMERGLVTVRFVYRSTWKKELTRAPRVHGGWSKQYQGYQPKRPEPADKLFTVRACVAIVPEGLDEVERQLLRGLLADDARWQGAKDSALHFEEPLDTAFDAVQREAVCDPTEATCEAKDVATALARFIEQAPEWTLYAKDCADYYKRYRFDS